MMRRLTIKALIMNKKSIRNENAHRNHKANNEFFRGREDAEHAARQYYFSLFTSRIYQLLSRLIYPGSVDGGMLGNGSDGVRRKSCRPEAY
jgi:hypothetical protein